MPNVEDIEGIGPAFAEKLAGAGVNSIDDLLSAGATKKGRTELEEKTGISGAHILKWVNHADLIRIKGIGPEYAELLEAAGVDSVPELAQRNPANLHAKMVECNTAKELVRQVASEGQVEKWVEEAKTLDRVVTH